jgi:outer membrane protein assembly factor BamB
MKSTRLYSVIWIAMWLGVLPALADGNWLQWRGPLANGVAPDADPPLEWSETQNVRWKVPIPGDGLSVPLVADRLVFIQTAVPVGEAVAETDAPEPERRGRGGRRRPAPTQVHKFDVLALDRQTGKTVWRTTVREMVPHEGSHRDGSLAPASPVTDGKHLYACFGSRGLYCLDMQGNVRWEKDLGDMSTRNGFGEGSSPVLAGDLLVVNWDHEGDSFIVALDAATGDERWRRPRDDERTSWATPLIVFDEKTQLAIVPGTERIRAYELATGKVRWSCGGLGSNCVPCPVDADGTLILMSGHRQPGLVAIDYRGATGDLTGGPRVRWTLDKGTPYVPSPLLYDDTLYFLQRNKNILSCHEPRTGKPHYDQQRLGAIDGVYASPVGAQDRVYIVGRNGVTCVLRRGPKFEVLATNRLEDTFDTSPALAGGELYLRGRKHLYCVARD